MYDLDFNLAAFRRRYSPFRNDYIRWLGGEYAMWREYVISRDLPYPVPEEALHARAGEPKPEPWIAAFHEVVHIVSVKVAMQGAKVNEAIFNDRITAILDEGDLWCPTPPPKKWPFPKKDYFQFATELTILTNSLQPGDLKNELQNVTRMLVKGSSQSV